MGKRRRGKGREERVVSRYRGSYDDIRGRMALHESGRDWGITERIKAAARRLGLPWDDKDERLDFDDALRGASGLASRPTWRPKAPSARGAEAFAASEEMASVAASKPGPREGPVG